jgi:pimeloyl-ACP methyl ester carboxylesterase
VIAPAYPGFEVEVEALNADPTPIERLKVPAIIERLEAIIGELDRPPIIIGHSAGGVFTQILLDHGFGAAGVAIDSAPTEGVKRIPLSQVRRQLPGAQEPGEPPQGRRPHVRAVALHVHQRPPEDEARRLYERYHVPASGEVFWGSALANIHPARTTPG